MLVSIIHRLIWIFFQPVMRIFAKEVILNREKILKLESPIIFISNHKSHFDPFLISGTTSLFGSTMPIRFFARDIFFARPFFKNILWLLGAFPGNIGYGIERAAKTPLEFLNAGYSVGLFPEWCFPDEPEFSRMQLIAPYISQRSQRPIVPVFLYGVHGISWGKIFKRRKKIIISLGNPLYPDQNEKLEKYVERINRGMLDTQFQCIHYLKNYEHQFWSSYAKFYKYLELAEPYQRMLDVIRKMLPAAVYGKWLDIGTGSGAMISLLLERDNNSTIQIIATDFNEEMLGVAQERFKKNSLVHIEKLDLNQTIPYPASSFSGVIANLVLPYITHHDTTIGGVVYRMILEEVFRILMPGGHLIFSTPKYGVNFIYVALGSWRSFFDKRHPEYRSYALSILRHAFQIQEWGRREVYNFLPLDELESLVHKIGFRNIQIKNTLTRQVFVVSCQKPAAKSI